MSDDLDTILEAEPHTLAKHRILKSYLSAWTAILSRYLSRNRSRVDELRIFDAFAGPGVYKNGEKGSPLLAIEAVLNHRTNLSIPVRFTFIEKRHDRFESLREQLELIMPKVDESQAISSVRYFEGECVDYIGKWLDKLEAKGQQLGPAFFFLDQFGYSGVPIDLIRRIMGYPMCECLSFINWSKFGWFMSDESKWPAINRAFGGDGWKSAVSMDSSDKERFIQESYKAALRDKAGVKHVWHFAMRGAGNRLTHWLFFATNNERGLEEMKKAMIGVDPSGGFAFSDRSDPNQYLLLPAYDDAMLEKDLVCRFRGKEVTVAEIKTFVLTDTPVCAFKKILKQMEKNRQLKVVAAPPERKSGFGDDSIIVRFE